MFIRPAMSESQFDHDNDMEWGMSDPFDPDPVWLHPEDGLIPHPFPSRAEPATADEARAFWLDGGWDDW